MNESLIDDPNPEHKNSDIFSIIGWWEKKRIAYNLILILFEIFFYSIGTREISRFLFFEVLAAWLFIFFGANILFCAGWGLELLTRYYFRSLIFSNAFRTTILAGGIIVSLLVLFVVSHMIFILI